MAGAYSTIANDGVYIEPTFYTKINKENGTTILEIKQRTRKVFSKEVAYIIKELLTQPVLGENGTATYCKISGVDVAAKTGTTDENYDRWLCGFTPYYTAVTWYGYDINESINFNQRNPAGLIWANVMSRIHAGLNTATFTKPSNISSATICAKTGKKATSTCPKTYTEYFLWFTTPDLCDEHLGEELKNSNNNVEEDKNVTEIIQGITNEIDEKEPTVNQQNNITSNNNNIINTNNTTTNNTYKNTTTNNTNNNNTNQTNNTSNINTTNNEVNNIYNQVNITNSTDNTSD